MEKNFGVNRTWVRIALGWVTFLEALALGATCPKYLFGLAQWPTSTDDNR